MPAIEVFPLVSIMNTVPFGGRGFVPVILHDAKKL
jgi:hypothetical protein